MKEIERQLRENLQREAPDHREEILAAEPRQSSPLRPRRRLRRLAGAVCGLAAVAVLAVGTVSDWFPWNIRANNKPEAEAPDNIEGVLTDQSQNAEGGDGRGEYEVVSWKSDVKLPDGESYNVYAFTGNDTLGKSVLALVNRLFGTEFSEDLDLSEYECRLGDDPSELFLWGNLDAGMFYYQHIIDYTREEIVGADPAVILPKTEKIAGEIAEKLSELVGSVRLEKKWQEQIEGPEDTEFYGSTYYYYRYAPEKPIVIDGYATAADLTICFDTLGEVTSLRCDMSACEKYVHHSVTFGENILEAFKNTLGDVGVPEAEVCITGCRIEYVQTIGLEDYAHAGPVLMLTYSINGEGEYECPLMADEV